MVVENGVTRVHESYSLGPGCGFLVLPVHDTTGVPTPPPVRGQRVQLIKEDHTWSSTLRTREHFTDVLFTLTHVHVDKLWSLYTAIKEKKLRFMLQYATKCAS